MLAATGMLAASYTHRTSRAGDPHLHEHMIVANAVQGVDGEWSSLHGTLLYEHSRVASGVYRAKVRGALADLNLGWEFSPDGLAEPTIVPHDVCREFSRRRRDIEKAYQEHAGELEARGLSQVEAAQFLARSTRPPKVHGVDPLSVAATWHSRAEAMGFGRQELHQALLDQQQTALEPTDLGKVFDRLLGPAGLTHERATFSTRDVMARIADSLPEGVQSYGELVALSEQFLSDPRVVRLSPGEQTLRNGGAVDLLTRPEERYTTTEFLHLEECLIRSATARVGQGAGVVDQAFVAQQIAKRPFLGEDQVEMVRRLTGSGDGLAVVHSFAGAGKTRGLEAACAAWQQQGYTVIGAAVAKRAASELAVKAGIPTVTLVRLMGNLAHPETTATASTVLVIDEAGMVGTRDIAFLEATCARVGAKLVLTGDSKQLPEITAGGGYSALVRRLPAIELTGSRRQHDPVERERLAALRSGDPGQAMRSYDQDGLLVRADTYDVALTAAATGWLADYQAGRDTVMLALTREVVGDLNTAARQLLTESGTLTGPQVEAHHPDPGSPGTPLRAGDLVVTKRNDTRLGVDNGDRWTVTEVDPQGQKVQLSREGSDAARRVATLSSSYLARPTRTGKPSVQHAYAVTTHVGQGSDVEAPHIFASPSAYKELGYTAASRAAGCLPVWYMVHATPSVADNCCPKLDEPDEDVLEELVAALGRSQAKTAAVDTVSAEPRIVRLISERPVDRMDREALDAEQAALLNTLRRNEPPVVAGLLATREAALGEAQRQLSEATVDVEVACEQLDGLSRWAFRQRKVQGARVVVLIATQDRRRSDRDELASEVQPLAEAARWVCQRKLAPP